jgi:arylsulfatase A-like enzyme
MIARVVSCVLLVLMLFAVPGPALPNRPTNIVLVIGDDHGWPDSGFMGHGVIETPNLDRLAAEGTLFTNAQLPASVCRPTLQTLLTGLHPEQWTATRSAVVARSGPIPFREEVVHFRTLPGELARRGYRSWEGGKMWEGTFAQAGFSQGMANTRPLGQSGVDGAFFGRDGWEAERCGESRVSDAPCPALDPLRAFLDEADDDPFFLWFAPMLPHLPFDPPPEFTARYRDRGLTPDEILYFAQVTRLDAVIGELLLELEQRGLQEDTLVIYMSDNGWRVGQGAFGALGHGKGSLHELATRTPVVFHWPGRVPDGVVREDLVAAEDLFPTILDYAGAEPLPDRPGRSLRPAIERSAATGRDRYVSSFLGVSSEYRGFWVRTPMWRYIAFEDGHEELYAIAEDPFEEHDLASARADLLPGFRADVAAWRHAIVEPPPRLEISGRLVDEAGAPIPGASLGLDAATGDLVVRTGADGTFRFLNLPHGGYRIVARAGVSTLLSPVGVSLPVGPTGAHLPGLVGRPESDPRTRRSGTAIVSGRLLTRDRVPLVDTRVFVRDIGDASSAVLEVGVRTDPTGRWFAENLPAGRYRIEAEVPAGFRAANAEIEVTAGTHRIQNLTTAKIRLAGEAGTEADATSHRR